MPAIPLHGRTSVGGPTDLARLLYRAGFEIDEAEIKPSGAGPPLVLIDAKLFERRSLRIDDLRTMCAAYRVQCLIQPRCIAEEET